MSSNHHQAPEAQASRDNRVLVVEADESIRSALRLGLELAGYEVVAVKDGAAALARLHDALPDLILIDLAICGSVNSAFLDELERLGVPGRVPLVVLCDDCDRCVGLKSSETEACLRRPLKLPLLLGEVARLIRQPTPSAC